MKINGPLVKQYQISKTGIFFRILGIQISLEFTIENWQKMLIHDFD